ncbi:uncharacterized protein LOC129592310 [Paramacrobiotus metropolitanus]|uniref:uncharacterized protein LOC129592310 n=1 Tax=Paramacrobiotus metropolitanus TaxID=2943436 RepID=UPI002446281F|nr:uncharacterized protein LOC129592310 [Paramacrobiotus metropolitanus]
MTDGEWRSQVNRKLQTIITDPNEYAEVASFLAAEEDRMHGYKNSGKWNMLHDVVGSDERFRACVKRIKRDIGSFNSKGARNSSVPDIDHSLPTPECTTGYSHWGAPDTKDLALCGAMGCASGLAAYPAAQAGILQVAEHLVIPALMPALHRAATVVRAVGRMAPVALAAVALSLEAMQNITRWWKGEISGQRVAKNLIDCSVTLVAGGSAGLAGAAIGGFLGPLGAVVGGVIGGLLVGGVTSSLTDWLTEKLFDIPRDEALEKAYTFFGCSMRSSNERINARYHAACKAYHPDKGGSHDMFLKVQACMAIIKVARGEQYGMVDQVRYLAES